MDVSGNIPVMYDVEGVGAFGTLYCDVWDLSNALSESTNIVWVGLVPVLLEPGVVA